MIDHRLIAFEAVLQEGSFERAARRLALTQSAISQRVKLLEAELGQVLLVRSKPVRPTPAGRRLLPYLAQLRLMEAEARRALARVRRTARCGWPSGSMPIRWRPGSSAPWPRS
ncbi:LysR family transcriptional regulator [Thauera humireducens]|uniref:LysR family transcriptional regulator n=1 Tax=Thauera humireducens TaxID=1134435 RepID=UPI00311DFCD2